VTRGVLSIVLHAHLPYVRHPEYPEFLEEDWLYEAITETYLPMLEVFDRCVDDGVPFRITMTLTPPLVGMLRDELLLSRYAKRLDALCEPTRRSTACGTTRSSVRSPGTTASTTSTCAGCSTTGTSATWSGPSSGCKTTACSRSSPAARPTGSCR
jgi:hypothetical protein